MSVIDGPVAATAMVACLSAVAAALCTANLLTLAQLRGPLEAMLTSYEGKSDPRSLGVRSIIEQFRDVVAAAQEGRSLPAWTPEVISGGKNPQ